MTAVATDRGVELLLRSSEPLIRYRALLDLVGVAWDDPRVTEAHAAIPEGPIVRALLTDAPGRHPYSKWIGAHWRLASLMDLGLPVDIPALRDPLEQALEAVMRWLTGPRDKPRALKGPVIRGLHRRCASQEGNGLAVAVHLGRADDPRIHLLVESLLDWQWPDGGWNCDRHADAHHSSANETFAPLRGLAAFARRASDRGAAAAAREAADRTAEFFLRHRVAFSERTGRPMNPRVVALHYPPYWHYDLLVGLRTLAESGHLGDPRTADALDLLESRRRPDGTWPADDAWYGRPGTRASLVEVADWNGGTRGGTNEALTLSALLVLKAAGRLA
jgi:hypothetical protein